MAQETQTAALYQPRGVGWGGRWEEGSKARAYIYTLEILFQCSFLYCDYIKSLFILFFEFALSSYHPSLKN